MIFTIFTCNVTPIDHSSTTWACTYTEKWQNWMVEWKVPSGRRTIEFICGNYTQNKLDYNNSSTSNGICEEHPRPYFLICRQPESHDPKVDVTGTLRYKYDYRYAWRYKYDYRYAWSEMMFE